MKSGTHKKPMKIPFVDDEEMVVEWGRPTLLSLGYDVTIAGSGQEALKMFLTDPKLFLIS
jgi:CheY-like chemotaxis protein